MQEKAESRGPRVFTCHPAFIAESGFFEEAGCRLKESMTVFLYSLEQFIGQV
jgi:hypothetical protein